MKNLKSKGRKLLSFTLAMATALTLMPFGGETVSAATLSNQGVSVTTGQDAITLAQSLVGEGITIESAKKICADDLQVGTVSNGEPLFGVSGLILSTGDAAGTIENNDYHSFSQIDQDQDLAALIGQEGKTYGGDTAGLEFTMTATGTLLNFNYVFASREFDQGTNFNDIFGLFVSVNGGAYENIALIPEGNPAYAGKYVTIDNIREGNTINSNDTGEHTYFTADGPKASGSIYNGVSHIFTAQKEVNKGDTVSVKFVIADVGDIGYSSSVIIQAGSLSFDASGAKLDCVDEAIKKLDAGTYEITSDGNVYVFHVGNTKSIPIQGTDANGKPYDFIGKTVSIVKCINETQKSDATEIEIPERAATPEVVGKTEVAANDKSITVVKPVPSQEYILVPAGTNVTDEVWGNAQKSDGSSIIFTKDSLGNTLTGTEEYVLYTRVYATKESLKSESSGASCEFTLHEHTASEWIVDKPASTTEEGSMHRECTSCKEVLETKVIPKYTGSVAYEPEVSEGAPATDVVVDEDALKDKVLTDAEKTIVKNGGNADIKLAVTAIETTVSDSEKEKVNAILGDNQKTGMYIDISLLLKVVDNNGNVIKEKEKIHEPGETFTIQLTVPDDLISNDADTTRTYQIVRVHNGVAEILDTEWDASTQTITFETDKFSTYAILYTDSDTNNNNSNNNNGNNNNNNSNNSNNNNNSTNNNNSNKNNSTSTNNSNKNNGTTLTVSTNAVAETDAAVSENAISTVTSAPQTGDDAQTGMWLALILAGVFLLGIAKKRAW